MPGLAMDRIEAPVVAEVAKSINGGGDNLRLLGGGAQAQHRGQALFEERPALLVTQLRHHVEPSTRSLVEPSAHRPNARSNVALSPRP